MEWLIKRGVLVLIVLFGGISSVIAAPATSIAIKTNAAQFKQALENLPYAKEGKGPVLYIFEFSECPYCQQMYKDFNGVVPGVEARYVFYAVSQRSANEAAALGQSRNIADYHAFMKRQKTAPAANSTDASIDAYNSIQTALTRIILPTLQRNGWRNQSLVSPTFIWEENGQWYADGGYRKDHFEKILASVKSDGGSPSVAGNTTTAAKDGLAARNSVAQSSVPQLTWRELIGHPERWPQKTTLLVGITVEGVPINEGTVMAVYDVKPNAVELVAPKGYTLSFEPNETTMLADANAYWSTLTPEQRALTLQVIASDRSLWPFKVTIKENLNFGRIALREGSEVSVVDVRADKIGVYDPRTPEMLMVEIKYTDLFKRSRELAALPVNQRPGMMAEILKGLTVDSNGKPVQVKDAKYYVLYIAASTCGFCQVFTPEFVKYYNQNFKDRDDVAFVVWPWENALPTMFAYMKKESMPWPTLPAWQKGRVYFLINGLGAIHTPGIVVVDKYTNVLVSSSKMPGEPTQRASAAVNQMLKVLK